MMAQAPNSPAPPPSGRLADPLSPLIPRIEQALAAALDRMTGAARMIDACRYAVLGGGGKRVRPALVLLTYEAAGGAAGSVRGGGPDVAAVAVEFVHTFSLVHDDLPCMDDDDLRRGRPTLHVAMGECSAVLAGDLLLAEAMTMLGRDVADPALAARLACELGEATGRMISGQSWDTEGAAVGERAEAPIDQLRRIHEHKTGALIRAACRMGGLAAGAAPERLAALTRYGEALGLLFQVTDDLLDVEQSPEAIGKQTGKDAAAGKLTYPGLLGVAGARNEAARLRKEAEAAAEELGAGGRPLATLAGLVAERTR